MRFITREIRSLAKIHPRRIDEAFQVHSLKKAAKNIFSYLGKKVGWRELVGISEDIMVPTYYSLTGIGNFVGFEAYLTSGGKIRLDFSIKDGSGKVYSVSWFEKPARKATKYIKIPPQFNIVEVLDHVIVALTGEYSQLFSESISFRERVRKFDFVREWLTNTPDKGRIYSEIKRRGTDWDGLLVQYYEYHESKGQPRSKVSLNKVTFQVYCSKIFKEEGQENLSNSIPHVNVSAGVEEQAVSSDVESENLFQNELLENEHIEKFEYLKFQLYNIKNGDPNTLSLYIYGRGGIGKSYWAKKILGDLPNTYYTKGKIKGYQGLLQLLYDHKDNEILILDDIISKEDMKNTTIENILKAVLDPEPPRRVKVERRIPSSEISSAEAPISGEEDIVDFTSEQGIIVEDNLYNFEFNSRVVFITNYPEKPQAFGDRVLSISMLFSDTQVADIIKNVLDKIEPVDVGIENKQFILNWLQERYRGRRKLQQLSFRVFQKVLSIYMGAKHLGGNKWQKWAFYELAS